MIEFFVVFGGFALVLALPAAVKEKFGIRWLIAWIATLAGVVLPLFLFFFTSLCEPEWKGACVHGWVDCFCVGKLALVPVAIFATIALYTVEVLRVKDRTQTWIVVGMLQGMVLAFVCCGFSLICLPRTTWWQLVPIYVAVWYLVRAGQLIWESRIRFNRYFFPVLGALPFWVVSWLWAYLDYKSLPDTQPPGCFIVTAASRGHESMVGPFIEITRNGRQLRANQQLLTFWEFEARWQTRAPGTHAQFRQVYNRIGPVIAARIKSPWMADATCLALKPMEYAARWINHNHKE